MAGVERPLPKETRLDDDPRLFRASALVPAARRAPIEEGQWPPPGRIVELVGGLGCAVTSSAVDVVVRAQRAGEIVAWLQPEQGLLFPPDLDANGVDLDALVVVHVPAARADADPRSERRGRSARKAEAAPGHELPRAAELLLRSGAFDLLVLDLRPLPPKPGVWLGRLQALARHHQSRVLLLSRAEAPVQHGSTATVRIEPARRRDAGGFAVQPRVVRDKLHDGVVPAPARRRGPTGLA